MIMRTSPRLLPALLAVLLSVNALSAERIGHSPSAPNILVLIADDLGWGDVGFHKGSILTPNLDRLAKEGVELQRFYVYPVCSPTRAERGEIDLYLLGALKERNRWTIRGFRLFHLGETEVWGDSDGLPEICNERTVDSLGKSVW
jgi:hypothetical protein